MPDTTLPPATLPRHRQGEARRAVRGGASTLGDPAILSRAAVDALRKLDPRRLVRNPVIFVTEIVSVLVTVLAVLDAANGRPWAFAAGIAAWLWLTVLFATFAEAVAEGRGRAQADSLRRARAETRAKLLPRSDLPVGDRSLWQPRAATELRPGELVLVDREQGGAERLARDGLRLHACYTLREVLTALRDAGRIENETYEGVMRYLTGE